jgi:NHLM bacteriocin system ABC transporter ATP-binding protein
MSLTSATRPTPTIVRGNSTLLLTEENMVWTVHSGTVAVFAVAVQDGEPVGPRRYLFSCNVGEWLFGSDPKTSAGQRSFLVVGLDDSELAATPLLSLPSMSKGESLESVAPVEAWVRRIGSVISARASHSHAERAYAGGPILLAAGQSIKPPTDQVLWMTVSSGTISPADASGATIGPESRSVPVSGDMRLVAQTDSELSFERLIDIEPPTGYANGLAKLHRLCFEYLYHLDERQREQDAQRLANRQELQTEETSSALGELGEALFRRGTTIRREDDLMTALEAIGDVLGVAFRRQAATSADSTSGRDPIEAIAHASRVRARRVQLRGEWWNRDAGPILGLFGSEGRPVALLPSNSGYLLYDPVTGKRSRVDNRLDGELSREAVTFVSPLPENAMSLSELAKFAMRPIALDLSLILFLSASITVLGMLVPIATGLVIDEAIPDANIGLLSQLAAGLFAMAVAQTALSYSQSTILIRTDTGLTARLQTAVIDRLLRLHARFFRRFSSGDLQNRSLMITQISRDISNTAVNGILTGIFALLNLALCVYYNFKLAMLAVAAALLIAIYTAGFSTVIRGAARKLSIGQGKLFGFQVQLISGIAKLRVAGAEQRAFNNWARRMASQLRLMSRIQRTEQWGNLVNVGLKHATAILLYYFAATWLLSTNSVATTAAAGPTFLTIGTFLAFYAAFQKMIGGLTELSSTLVDLGDTWAKRRLVMPLLEEVPEDAAEKVDPGPLAGTVSMGHITFRYREDGPLVLNDVCVQANAGQFVAIVGPSGSGKSTLLRILLGFETPEAGTIYYDGQDLAGLDSGSVRRQIGVVLQSGVVNSGSLYENIAGAARVSLDETWEAARAAGLAEDIEQMPMGMHTFVNEGGSTLSGGQRQRLLIARALVTKPKILIFDEATSSLDNRTQQIVTESLDRLQVTRIAVAHRFSTIRDADKIYVMDGGQIVQSGTAAELSDQDGLFRRLIARQLT